MKKICKMIGAVAITGILFSSQKVYSSVNPSSFSNEATYGDKVYRFAGSSSISTNRGGSETSAARMGADGRFIYDVSCYVSTSFLYRELYSGEGITESGWRSGSGGTSVYYVTPSNVPGSKSYSGVSASGSHSAYVNGSNLSNSTYNGI